MTGPLLAPKRQRFVVLVSCSNPKAWYKNIDSGTPFRLLWEDEYYWVLNPNDPENHSDKIDKRDARLLSSSIPHPENISS